MLAGDIHQDSVDPRYVVVRMGRRHAAADYAQFPAVLRIHSKLHFESSQPAFEAVSDALAEPPEVFSMDARQELLLIHQVVGMIQAEYLQNGLGTMQDALVDIPLPHADR